MSKIPRKKKIVSDPIKGVIKLDNGTTIPFILKSKKKDGSDYTDKSGRGFYHLFASDFIINDDVYYLSGNAFKRA